MTNEEFIKEVYSWGTATHMNDEVFILPEEIILHLEDRDGEIWIKTIKSVTPRKGNGTKFILKLLELADREKKELHLQAEPYGITPMPEVALMQWYEKHGFRFKSLNSNKMKRDPLT